MAAISSAPQRPAASDSRLRLRARTWRLLLKLVLIAGDMLALNGAVAAVYLWQLPVLQQNGLVLPSEAGTIWMFATLLTTSMLVAFAFSGLYDLKRGASRIDEAYKVFIGISLTTMLALIVNTLFARTSFQELPFTGQIVAFSWLAAIISVTGIRLLYRSFVIYLRSRGIDTRRVIIVGAREPGRAVWNTIRRIPELGYRVEGFLSDSFPVGSEIEGLPVLGRSVQLGRAVRATLADEVIIALSGRSHSDLLEIVALAEDESIEIKVYPDTFQLITNNGISIGDVSGLPLVRVKNAALDNPWNQVLKRGLDLVVAAVVLLLFSPLMLLLALLIKLESREPVFFLQERVGMDNQPFLMIKFRTMRTDAEVLSTWTTPDDPRITRIGRFLRRSSLDELPQFINVLLGEMSVVGPRPEQPRWVEQFSQQIPRYMRRHKEKAGITGWAQVNGLRGDTSIEERTRYDLYYVENWSLLLDIKIIVRTMAGFLSGKQENAY